MTIGTGLNRAQVIVAALNILKDNDELIWTEAELSPFVDEVVREISKRDPKRMTTALPFKEYTRHISITSLSNLIEIYKVEHPPENTDRFYRNIESVDVGAGLLKVKLDYAPVIVDGELTGTLTFTKDSQSVSGDGTLFESELQVGYFIKLSDGTKWYRIAKIDSNVLLYLDRDFEETTHTDDEDASDYMSYDSMAYVYWGCSYTVGDSATDCPAKYDEILVVGTVALALHAEQTKQINVVPIGDNVPITYRGVADRYMQRYYKMLEEISNEDDIVSVGWCSTA